MKRNPSSLSMKELEKLLFPKWSKMLKTFSAHERQEFIYEILKDIECDGNPDRKPTPEGKKFVKMLKEECVFVGFEPCSLYFKAEGRGENLDADFIHPWGMVTLKYKHKKWPCVITTNAGMRLNQMRLLEIAFNHGLFGDDPEVIGLTN